MKTTLLLLVSILLINYTNAQESLLSDHIKSLSNELEANYAGKKTIQVAVLDFRTSDNRITAFNTYLQNAFQSNYKGSVAFRLIDQNNINRLLSNSNWDLDQSNDFTTYASLREDIFSTLGVGADAFIYGQINDNDETITITAYLIPQGVKPSRTHATITFPSSEETDRLLGKPVKQRPKPRPQRDTVVVVRDRIVEREVRLVDTVVIEREVERPVVVREKIAEPSDNVINIHGYRFELNSIERLHDGSLTCKMTVTRTHRDMELTIYRNHWRGSTKLFDSSGAEYNPESIAIANKSEKGSYIGHRFIENVPTPVTFRVQDVDPEIALISLFEIVLGDASADAFNIQFRNIRIE